MATPNPTLIRNDVQTVLFDSLASVAGVYAHRPPGKFDPEDLPAVFVYFGDAQPSDEFLDEPGEVAILSIDFYAQETPGADAMIDEFKSRAQKILNGYQPEGATEPLGDASTAHSEDEAGTGLIRVTLNYSVNYLI